jgi:hypothetical protein
MEYAWPAGRPLIKAYEILVCMRYISIGASDWNAKKVGPACK